MENNNEIDNLKPINTVVGEAFNMSSIGDIPDFLKNKYSDSVNQIQDQKSQNKNGKFIKRAEIIDNNSIKNIDNQKDANILSIEKNIVKENIKVINVENTNLKNINLLEKPKEEQKVKNSIPIQVKSYEKIIISEDCDNDLFNEDGLIDTDEDIVFFKEKIKNSFNSSKMHFNIIKNKLFIFFAKNSSVIFLKANNFLSRFSKKSDIDKAIIKEDINKKEVQQITYIKSDFNEISELNIIFTDNYNVNINKKTNYNMSKSEMQLLFKISMEAIKQCSKFTLDSPDIGDGIYKGKKISYIMDNVVEEDIALFFGYVKSKPGSYIGKKWKISETFATWLLNDSPLAINKNTD